MKPTSLLSTSLLACGLGFASALTLTITPRGSNPTAAGLSFQPLDHIGTRYTTNITINEVPVTVLLDTGSTDFWVQPPNGVGENLKQSTVGVKLAYGDGTNIVTGYVAVAPLEFGGYSIPQQAFLNVNKSGIVEEQFFSQGIYGLVGLSFDSPGASPINDAVRKVYGENATWGQSVLANIFGQHPDKENLIGMSLSRTDDMEGTAEGALYIGEFGEKHAAAPEAAKPLPLFPPKTVRWGVLLDAVLVDGTSIPLKSNSNSTPEGKQVAVFDTGAPTFTIPRALINSIFSLIPGAKLATNMPSDAPSVLQSSWVVPCLANSSVEAVFGGVNYPIHPLDLTEVFSVTAPDNNNYTFCVSHPFEASEELGSIDFDGLWGAPFLRNTYTVFDFGDNKSTRDPSGTAFVKLVSQTDAKAAAADTTNVRAKTIAATGFPELRPEDLLALFADQSKSATQHVQTDTTPTNVPTSSSSATTSPQVAGDLKDFAATDNDANSTSSLNAALNKWGPLIIGLLAGNLVIGAILLVLGVISCVRRGGKIQPSSARSAPSYTPVKFKDDVGDSRMSQSDDMDKPYGQ